MYCNTCGGTNLAYLVWVEGTDGTFGAIVDHAEQPAGETARCLDCCDFCVPLDSPPEQWVNRTNRRAGHNVWEHRNGGFFAIVDESDENAHGVRMGPDHCEDGPLIVQYEPIVRTATGWRIMVKKWPNLDHPQLFFVHVDDYVATWLLNQGFALFVEISGQIFEIDATPSPASR